MKEIKVLPGCSVLTDMPGDGLMLYRYHIHSMRWDFDYNMSSPLLRIHCVFLVSESTGAEG